jgi:hypothetical protein
VTQQLGSGSLLWDLNEALIHLFAYRPNVRTPDTLVGIACDVV